MNIKVLNSKCKVLNDYRTDEQKLKIIVFSPSLNMISTLAYSVHTILLQGYNILRNWLVN